MAESSPLMSSATLKKVLSPTLDHSPCSAFCHLWLQIWHHPATAESLPLMSSATLKVLPPPWSTHLVVPIIIVGYVIALGEFGNPEEGAAPTLEYPPCSAPLHRWLRHCPS